MPIALQIMDLVSLCEGKPELGSRLSRTTFVLDPFSHACGARWPARSLNEMLLDPTLVHVHSIWFHPSLISFLPLVLISYNLASALRSDASKIKFTKALAASAKSSPDIISILGCGQLPDLGMKKKCRASLCSWIMSGMWEGG